MARRCSDNKIEVSMKDIRIGNKVVNEFAEPLIIADVGANFNGDMNLAKKMVLKAKEAGIDVVKFQCWTKDTIVVKSEWENKPAALKSFGHERQDELLDFLALSVGGHQELKRFCDENEIMFSSTPISLQHVDLLTELDVPFFKVASMDLNHLSFLRYIAKKGKPIVLSTGMGTINEISKAVEVIYGAGNEQLILLHCTSLYPPDDNEVNLNNIDYLREVFGIQVGYSDHTLGYSIPLAAVVKGVSVIEKHYTLDKTMVGWDHAVSATPEEFEVIVKESKRIVNALGNKIRTVGAREEEKKTVFRRSIVAKRDLQKGTVITYGDIDFKRPGTGIAPSDYEKVLNRKLNCFIKADDQLQWEYFE